MSFREKSAWAMGVVMLVTGLFYAAMVLAMPRAPLLGPLIPYVLAVIVLSIVAQAVLGIASPREANAPADERETVAIDRAGHWSGNALGLGVATALIFYVSGVETTLVMHGIMATLIVSTVVEYALQIWFFRRGTA